MGHDEPGGHTAVRHGTAGLVDGPFTETKELLGAVRGRRPSVRPEGGVEDAVAARVDWRPAASS